MGGADRGVAASRRSAESTSAPSSSASSTGSSQDKPSSAGDKVQRRSCLQNQLHKTKFCMYHLKGTCQFGRECAFAHAYTELQATPDLRKTRLCTDFMEGKGCTNEKCPFAHGEEELRSTDMFYKKTLCIWNEKGKCRNGDQCRFAHGMTELRANQGLFPAALESCRAGSTGGGVSPAAPGAGKVGATGRKAKAAAKRGKDGTSTAVHKEARNAVPAAVPAAVHASVAPAEPMKIHPTRSLLLDEDVRNVLAGPMVAPPGAVKAADGLHGEIERLRQVISALTVQCSAIKQNMYTQGLSPQGPAAFDMDLGFGGHEASLDHMFQGAGWPAIQAWQGNVDDRYLASIAGQ